jgi:hypothetical protein
MSAATVSNLDPPSKNQSGRSSTPMRELAWGSSACDRLPLVVGGPRESAPAIRRTFAMKLRPEWVSICIITALSCSE